MFTKISKILLFLSLNFHSFLCNQNPLHLTNSDKILPVFPSHKLTSLTPKIPPDKLQLDSCSYFTHVNIIDKDPTSETSISNSIPMTISLYTNNSYLISPFAKGCDNFGFYDCDLECNVTTTNSVIEDPFLHLEGNITYVNIELDNLHLKSSHLQLLYVDKCIRNHPEETFNSVSGSLGLGIGGTNRKIFTQDPSFSIFLHSDGQQGELIFGLDTSKIADYSSMTLFYSTNNWEIPLKGSISLKGSELTNSTHNFSGTVLFNVNACYIGFPADLFTLVLEWLSVYKFICNAKNYDLSLPHTCTYKGDPWNLPSISITDTLDGSLISIGPEIYLRKMGVWKYDFLIVQLDSKSLNEGFLNARQYDNIIMLGMPFLKWHYVYFGSEGTNTILIYHSINAKLSHSKEEQEEGNGRSYLGYLLLGFCIIVIVFILILAGLLYKQSRKKKPEMVVKSVQTLGLEPEQTLRDNLYIKTLQRQASGKVVNPSKFSQMSDKV